jgi:hypothetical protein
MGMSYKVRCKVVTPIRNNKVKVVSQHACMDVVTIQQAKKGVGLQIKIVKIG